MLTHTRRSALLLSCVVLVSVMLGGLWAIAHRATLSASEGIHWVRYPYLQQLGPTSAMIVWTTSEPGPSQVRYSTDPNLEWVEAATTRFVTTDATPPYHRYYEHAVTLTDLITNTAYNYAVVTQGVRLDAQQQLHFQTHPGPDVCVFDFAVFGDTGLDWQPTQGARDQARARGFDFAINLGDLAYPTGTYEALETKFFKIYRDTLSNQMMWTTIGNHEYYADQGVAYFDVFHLPEQALRPADDERYYSMNYGHAHFVFLDTNAPLQEISGQAVDDMADWLDADLTADDHFWTIVSMHHPWYVSDTRPHPTSILTRLVPIFEKHKVDIVFSGNDHLYERTLPIHRGVVSDVGDTGIVYVTNGSGSGKGADYGFIQPAPDWSAARSDRVCSYTHVYVRGGVMSLITIDERGVIIDPMGGDAPVVIIDRSTEPGASCLAGNMTR